MIGKRPGIHVIGMQLPTSLWRLIEKEAASTGISATRIVTLALADRYDVPHEMLPKPKKSGRPPKRR